MAFISKALSLFHPNSNSKAQHDLGICYTYSDKLSGFMEKRKKWCDFQENDQWRINFYFLDGDATEVKVVEETLHLTIARDIPAEVIATADKVMNQAAQLLNFKVVLFGEG